MPEEEVVAESEPFVPDEGCHNCEFWCPPSDEEGPKAVGQCWRYPPTLMWIAGELKSWRPETYGFEWCGEHESEDDDDELEDDPEPDVPEKQPLPDYVPPKPMELSLQL